MAGGAQIEIEVIHGMSEVSERDWDVLACPEGGRAIDPFTTYKFLNALEKSGSVTVDCGWSPRHLLARLDGRLIAAMPLYLKYHSQGEYVFDHGWANAFEGAGGRYYPKLQAAVPFTPATGRRFLTLPDYTEIGRTSLVQAVIKLVEENHLSSFHVTFCTEDEARFGQEFGLMHRTGQQFHWYNDGYGKFDDFLSRLSSRKRKAIRRERSGAASFGGTIHQFSGDEICEEHWDAFWRFYQDTGERKWGTPYLTRAFFDEVQMNLREETLLILCKREGRWVAGALNFIGRDTLFGRYWGCIEDHPFLHFEVCYYQAIDYAIRRGLRHVEAGAQGEHKLARGYLPAATHSLHWIGDPGFKAAVAQFLTAERAAVDEDIEILTSYGPFRRGGEERE
ncbi:MAG: N-acetyltransferase [Alphaproteobacteria bacterium]|nr:N-acetyltransferase [Alphaproteobacteria bacterium]